MIMGKVTGNKATGMQGQRRVNFVINFYHSVLVIWAQAHFHLKGGLLVF